MLYVERKIEKVEQDEDGWASWGWLGQVAIQVIREGLVKMTFEQILKAMRGSIMWTS